MKKSPIPRNERISLCRGKGELIHLREICNSLGSRGARDKGRCWGALMKILIAFQAAARWHRRGMYVG